MIEPARRFEGLNVSFHVTEECNLSCAYCYELNKQPVDLPYAYAKRFIELILTDPDPIGCAGTKWEFLLNQGLILDFIGGDALLKVELCDQILKYFLFYATATGHRWSKNFRISISTNATLFEHPGVKEFLNHYRDVLSLGVSVDGCPVIHNFNRSYSFAAILKSWDWYMDFTDGNGVTKATLNNHSIPFIYDSVKYLHETLGLKYISMNFVFDRQKTEPDLEELNRQLEKTVHYVLAHRNDLYLGLFDKYMRIGSPYHDPAGSWCGAGAMPCLDVNGRIYPCFRFVPQNMAGGMSDFYVGDICNGFNHKERFHEVRAQTREKISPDRCKECAVESACAWCIAGAYAETGIFHRQTYICEMQKIQARWAAEYWRLYEAT